MADTAHSYFESQYASDPDPWGFERRWYERRKFSLTLAALPHRQYRRAIEPGCSNGALTELLAPRCDELFSFDFVTDAVERTSQRLRAQPHVHVLKAAYPDYWPHGGGDLVVWSEVAYYLAQPSADRAMSGLERWLEPGGTLVAVHYTGDTDYPRHGSEIARWIDRVPFLQRTTAVVDEEFELGVWCRVDDGDR